MKLLMMSALLYNDEGKTCWFVIVAAITIVFYVMLHVKSMIDIKKDKLKHEAEYYKVLGKKTDMESILMSSGAITDSLKLLATLVEIEGNYLAIEHKTINLPFDVTKLNDDAKKLATKVRNALSKDYINELIRAGLTEEYIYDRIVSESYIVLLQIYQVINNDIVTAHGTRDDN